VADDRVLCSYAGDTTEFRYGLASTVYHDARLYQDPSAHGGRDKFIITASANATCSYAAPVLLLRSSSHVVNQHRYALAFLVAPQSQLSPSLESLSGSEPCYYGWEDQESGDVLGLVCARCHAAVGTTHF
jgi:hypothetical protein